MTALLVGWACLNVGFVLGLAWCARRERRRGERIVTAVMATIADEPPPRVIPVEELTIPVSPSRRREILEAVPWT